MHELPNLRAGRFVAVSWPLPAREKIFAFSRKLAGWTIASGDSWLFAAERSDCFARSDSLAVATCVPHLFFRAAAQMVGPQALLSQVCQTSGIAFAGLAAPYRLAWCDIGDGAMGAATDSIGLGQVFYGSTAEFSAFSSSSSLLASLLEAKPDQAALAAYAQFGSFPFEKTAFAGVTKLEPCGLLELKAGRISVTEWQLAASTSQSDDPSVADAMRRCVAAMVQADPDAALELSGGLDSRLVLAAMDQALRAGRDALTVGADDFPTPDVLIAREIAANEKLKHRIMGASRADLDRFDMAALVDHVTDGYDRMANPLDKVPLVLMNSGLNEVARFGGQNGEILRGFYYPLQPLNAAATPDIANRLIDFRLISNDKVTPTSLSEYAVELQQLSRGRVVDEILSYGGPLWQALDTLYLRFRMQSWVGGAINNRFSDRVAFWPFFDTMVLQASLQLPASYKTGSKGVYSLLHALDPGLSSIPLDTGIVPSREIKGGLLPMLDRAKVIAGKLRKKVGQKIGLSQHAVLGASMVGDAWYDQQAYKRLNYNGLDQLGLFDERFLEGLESGSQRLGRSDLGFVLLCHSVVSHG